MNETQKSVRPFGLRDKIGYMFGDFGNDFTFIFASSFLMVFYTKVLGIDSKLVGIMFVIARLLDAFTDVGMGRIVDKCNPRSDGKFRPWIRRMCGPVAIFSFLMYQSSLAGASMNVKIVYMFVTYLLWGSIFYTSINIPYGSMASAISGEPSDRTGLSTFRGIGASLAGLFIGVGAPLVIYTKDEAGNQIVNAPAFTLIAGVFSVLAIICYLLCYYMTLERVHISASQSGQSVTFAQTMKATFTNRALLAIIGAAIGLLLSQLLVQSMNNYLYADYFNDIRPLAISSVINTGFALVIAGITSPLSKKYGKKELAVVGTFFSGILYFILYFLKIQNPWVFVILSSIGFIGVNFFNMIIWANITDVIDYQEVVTGKREDGIVYSVYSFARKVGQALAGGTAGWALAAIGYQETATVQTKQVVQGLYLVDTLIPAILFFLVAMILAFFYPLTKKMVEENTQILKERHNGGNHGVSN